MNNVTLNNKNYILNNPTCYDAASIMKRYAAMNHTTVANMFADEKARVTSGKVAAQNLFVRAVRGVEYERNKNVVLNLAICYFIKGCIFDSSINNVPLPLLIPCALMAYLLCRVSAELGFWFFTGITDKMNINIQYSI